jgi:hypothetical protein
MRRTAEYIWTDYKTNTQIAKELKITQILDKLPEYKRNWIQHVNRMALKPLAPSDPYMGRTAQLTSRCCILNSYSTNIRTEYFKCAA